MLSRVPRSIQATKHVLHGATSVTCTVLPSGQRQSKPSRIHTRCAVPWVHHQNRQSNPVADVTAHVGAVPAVVADSDPEPDSEVAADVDNNKPGLTVVEQPRLPRGGFSRRAAGLAVVAGAGLALLPEGAMASAAPSDWLKQDKRRMLHAVYRVGDMDATIEYYKKHFGMKVLRYRDIPDEKYTNAFLGYKSETTNFALELTYNYGVSSYDLGDFGHFGLVVPDVYKAVDDIKKDGGKVTRDAGPVKGGTTPIAFVEDPTGYKWELLQRPESPEPICQVMLRVGDLEASKQYYQEVLGMQLLRTRDNPDNKYTIGFFGYGPEDQNTVAELTYNYGKSSYSTGKGYGQVAISTLDVYKTAEQIRAAGGKITREPGPIPGLGTKIVATTDPDGWKYVFVDEADFLKELEESSGGDK